MLKAKQGVSDFFGILAIADFIVFTMLITLTVFRYFANQDVIPVVIAATVTLILLPICAGISEATAIPEQQG